MTPLALATLLLGADPAPAPPGYAAIFDGQDLSAFNLEGEEVQHWVAREGILLYDGKGKDLWTRKPYRDFVLRLDWRLPRPGQSGIYLRGSSKSEVNISCDALGSGDVPGYRTDSRQLEEVRKGVTPRQKADRRVGEWNSFLIVMRGERLTVELNGERVIDGAHLPGVKPEGPIALQNDGDPIEFRGIGILELPANPEPLFDGKSLEGWLKVGAAPNTWTVRDGLLITNGKPHGYLRTTTEHSNYFLEAEWKFVKGGQTGLLLHIQPPDKVWPTSIEVQTDHRLAGNFIKIGDVDYEGGKRIRDAEKPAGEWNYFWVFSREDRIEVFMNGEKVSQVTDYRPVKGFIGFQSEGVEVHLRNIRLKEL